MRLDIHVHVHVIRRLERVVGKPIPNYGEGLLYEHCAAPDSKVEFETSNYGVRTTSEVEYEFVCKPAEQRPDGSSWPEESKLKPGSSSQAPDWKSAAHMVGKKNVNNRWKVIVNQARKQSHMRKPLSKEDLDQEIEKINIRLRSLPNENELKHEEAWGARLYTGPMYEKCKLAACITPYKLHSLSTASPCFSLQTIASFAAYKLESRPMTTPRAIWTRALSCKANLFACAQT